MAKKKNLQSATAKATNAAMGAQASFNTLLDLQKVQMSQLESIREVLEQTRPSMSPNNGEDQERVSRDSLKAQKELKEQMREFAEQLKKKSAEDAKIMIEVAASIKTFTSLGEKIADKASGLKEKYGTMAGLKKTTLSALNVGGVFNKTLARDEFIEKQRMLGSTKSRSELKSDFEGAQQTSKQIKKNEAQLQKFRDMGLSEEQIAKTPKGAELLKTREDLGNQYGKFDLTASLKKTEDIKGTKPPAEVDMSEAENESLMMQEKQLELFEKIEENTRLEKEAETKKTKEPVKQGGGGIFGGILDSVMDFFSKGFFSAIKVLFSPKMLLKAITKVFLPVMIIGSIVNGIIDGFKEFQESGDIGKALIAGLGGILDFLTFGLIDKETLTNAIDTVSEMFSNLIDIDALKEMVNSIGGIVSEYLIDPIKNFVVYMKDGLVNTLSKIGIPEMVLLDNKLTGKVSVGPYYPFADLKKETKAPEVKPSAPVATQAATVEAKSASNIEAAAKPAATSSNTVVSAPSSTVVNNQIAQVKLPTRNQDNSLRSYINSRYA